MKNLIITLSLFILSAASFANTTNSIVERCAGQVSNSLQATEALDSVRKIEFSVELVKCLNEDYSVERKLKTTSSNEIIVAIANTISSSDIESQKISTELDKLVVLRNLR